MATRWRSPPESSGGRRFSLPSRPSFFTSAASRSGSARPWSSFTGRTMFSDTVRASSRLKFWNTTPTWRRRNLAAALSESAVTSVPPISMRPADGVISPAARCRNVDFPLPLGPMSASNAPGASASSKSFSTSVRAAPLPYACANPVAFNASIVSSLIIQLPLIKRLPAPKGSHDIPQSTGETGKMPVLPVCQFSRCGCQSSAVMPPPRAL